MRGKEEKKGEGKRERKRNEREREKKKKEERRERSLKFINFKVLKKALINGGGKLYVERKN